MGVKHEEGHAGGFIVSEAELSRSREKVTVASGQDLKAGHVLGVLDGDATPAVAADGGNTGDGTVTGAATQASTQMGVYTLECIEAAADGGRFQVADPNGDALEDALVGTAYLNDQLGFTINDGAADFVVGDKFTITFVAGSGEAVEYDPTNVDGSQTAKYVLIDSTHGALAAATEMAVIARSAQVNASELVWFSGASAGQKTTGESELASQGIIARAAI